jgi:hypothetical protein
VFASVTTTRRSAGAQIDIGANIPLDLATSAGSETLLDL